MRICNWVYDAGSTSFWRLHCGMGYKMHVIPCGKTEKAKQRMRRKGKEGEEGGEEHTDMT